MKFSVGFTLVELLVVMAILGIVGVYSFSNFASYGEDQSLKNTLLDIQGILRQAQTNAKSNVVCGTQYGVVWKTEFPNTTELRLICGSAVLKTYTFQSNPIEGVTGTGQGCPGSDYTVHFESLTGDVSFGNLQTPDPRCTALTFILKNSKTGNTKLIKIEKEGRIYEP